MRIQSLQLVGIGPFEDTTVEFPAGGNPTLADTYLLVGQNGCGKTTVLHSLAALLGPRATSDLHVERRFRREDSAIAAISDDGLLWGAREANSAFPLWAMSDPHVGRERVVYFLPRQRPQSVQAWNNAILNGGNPDSALTWAVFSYAGARSVGDVNVTTITEEKEPPLSNALSFAESVNSQRLAQWVANQQFRYLKAAASPENRTRADAIEESIRRIQRAVTEIIGLDFEFYSEVDELNVRAKLNGSVIDFGLMPEGVKSIVSWIADLLMRMDRVSWDKQLPIHEREFLLLLDEIDVHLHPAWQRKLLPVVQKLFPKAQIIASTHSPFVVASLADGAVIELKIDAKGRASARPPKRAPLELSYTSTMRELFGIESDFDLETERDFKEFQAVGIRWLQGDASALEELDRRASELKKRGEEIAQLVQFELNQLQRRRPRPIT